MILAATSAALHHVIDRGDLTQLEFVDMSARELACDGIVLDSRHFPRFDDDYLAQIKKMTTDLGLVVVALDDATFFSAEADSMHVTLARAAKLGAPLVVSRLAAETTASWSEQLERITTATGMAKSANITLALRNAPGTFADSVSRCRRVIKESDSAWLRFAPECRLFDASDDATLLAEKAVVLWNALDADVDSALAAFPSFRGAIVVDAVAESGTTHPDDVRSAIRRWRTALAHNELNHT